MKAIKIYDETIFVGFGAYTSFKPSSKIEWILPPKKKAENAKAEDYVETEIATIEFSGANLDHKIISFQNSDQRDKALQNIEELLETTDVTTPTKAKKKDKNNEKTNEETETP